MVTSISYCYSGHQTVHDRQCSYIPNIEARSSNHSCRGKAISITCSECVFVALVIKHAVPSRCSILSSVACAVFFCVIS